MWHQTGFSKVKHFNGVVEIYIKQTAVAMSRKIWEF